MELPKSPVQTTIDMLAELNSRPDGWSTIAAQNILLNKSGNDAEQAEAEMCAFSAAGEIIGDEDLQGEPTRVIGLGRTAGQKNARADGSRWSLRYDDELGEPRNWS